MNAAKKRERRIPELEREILDDEEIRKLVRRGVLVPFHHAPRKPLDPAVIEEMRARMDRRRPVVEDEEPMLDHRGREPDHFEFGSDD